MTAETSAVTAAALYTIGLVVAFGVRSWAHRRATGTSGFRGLTGTPGSAPWWGGVLFAGALVLTTAGLVLALVVSAPSIAVGLRWAGLTAALAGFAGTVVAQGAMGSSWRIGVDEAERTALVTDGPFRLARNPIFTAMCAALAGLALMVPNLLTLVGFACLVLAVQLQVRVVEEPYLLATHGADYVAYARRVGRFVPALGRLEGTAAAAMR